MDLEKLVRAALVIKKITIEGETYYTATLLQAPHMWTYAGTEEEAIQEWLKEYRLEDWESYLRQVLGDGHA